MIVALRSFRRIIGLNFDAEGEDRMDWEHDCSRVILREWRDWRGCGGLGEEEGERMDWRAEGDYMDGGEDWGIE